VLSALATGLAIAGAAVLLRPATPSARAPEAWVTRAAQALNGGTASRPAARTTDLALEGERLRVERRFAEAAEAFGEAVRANPQDADAWADLADSQAAAAGRDLTKGREAIHQALAIDPRHRKALWLRASLELQERRYEAAAATWRELAALVEPGSADARVIAANIVEADSLAGSAQGAAGRGG
jgi:cytochrome c-type biogenesis protein CcmH/NrfG